MKILAGFFLILFFMLSSGFAADVDIEDITQRAEQGDKYAQNRLGYCCDSGNGVPQDDAESLKWYRLSAGQDYEVAQYNLGVCYLYGDGVPQDSAVAYTWFLKAARQGHPSAQYHLAVRYLKGDGVTKDLVKAVEWYQRSAEQGFASAQFDLALCYKEGDGVTKDLKLAVKWYRMAAEQGCLDAQNNLGGCYADGEGVPVDYTEAMKWYHMAAEQGDSNAQNNLGYHYSNGTGVIEDYVEAYAWYALSSMNGSSLAVKNKEILSQKLSNSQITAGQQRAKELQALIERKKAIAESDADKPLASDIAPSGYGSGLLVKGGYVLTCWHVIDDAERISISLNGKDHVASIVQKDAANDIAVLKVTDVICGASLNLSSDVKLGEKVFTLGYPHPDLQGSDVKFTTGSISSLTGIDNSPQCFQISAPIQPGNSGGPLFDEKGNLVGIVAAKLDSLVTLELTGDLPQNVNYAIKADYLVPVLKTVQGLEVGNEKTKDVNLLELIDELKQSVVMIKVY
jgi:TPR repeat protein